jgi:DNA-binding phage protein
MGVEMDKTKTSRKQKKSSESTPRIKLKKGSGLVHYSPTKELLDDNFIAKAVWECFKNNDPEGVIEIIQAHLEVVNKQRLAQEEHLPRSTLYNAFRGKNPTLKTLAKMIHCMI